MKKLLFLAALAALASCQFVDVKVGNGNAVDTGIEVADFHAIASRCFLSVIYTQMEGKPGVTLTCDENLVDCYRIVVEDGTLVVDTKNNVSFRTKVKSFLTVNSPLLNAVSVSGSGSCRITGPLVSEGDVDFKVSGSGSIRANGTVECQGFSSRISGSGSIRVFGVLADSARFKVSGSGSTRAGFLTADKVSLALSGSGGVRLACKDAGDIDVSISGSGGVHLSGNAHSLSSRVSGSGRVNSGSLTLGE